MEGKVRCAGPNTSGGLEELYTDFDAWITKRSWKFRQRIYQTSHEGGPNQNQSRTENYTTNLLTDYQDCLVNGFTDKKELYPEDLRGLIRLCKDGDELVYIDFVLIRLVTENGRTRILFVNRSKL